MVQQQLQIYVTSHTENSWAVDRYFIAVCLLHVWSSLYRCSEQSKIVVIPWVVRLSREGLGGDMSGIGELLYR